MEWWLFLTLTAWFYLVLRLLSGRRERVQMRIAAAARTRSAVSTAVPLRRAGLASVRRLARRVTRNWLHKWSQTRLERVQLKLAQADYPGSLSVAEWIGVRFLLAACGALLGGILLWLSHGQLTGLAMLLALFLLGWIGPDFWLSRRIRLRQLELMRQLPSALDLLTVSVEAGLGFDQAMARVAEKLKGGLADEFERALREIQLGSQRMAALQRLAARTGVDAVRSFVSAVVQADKLGVGMAQVLRVQAAEVRRRRKMDAEERAMKAPIKMLFPLVVFVFPALFVIILGPAVIHMLQLFSGSQ